MKNSKPLSLEEFKRKTEEDKRYFQSEQFKKDCLLVEDIQEDKEDNVILLDGDGFEFFASIGSVEASQLFRIIEENMSNNAAIRENHSNEQ